MIALASTERYRNRLVDPREIGRELGVNRVMLLRVAHLPDAQGPEWVALVLLVGTLVLFGVVPGIAIGPVDTATVPLLIRLGGMP